MKERWEQIPGVPPCGTVLINNTRCTQAKKAIQKSIRCTQVRITFLGRDRLKIKK
jgi:hypothetical protein